MRDLNTPKAFKTEATAVWHRPEVFRLQGVPPQGAVGELMGGHGGRDSV